MEKVYENLGINDIVYTEENGNIKKECWLDFPLKSDYFMVSNLGRVKRKAVSVNHSSGNGTVFKKEKILRQAVRKDGYCSITLKAGEFSKTMLVHRMVMYSFNSISDLIIDHINGNKSDNRESNLRYCTYRENSHYYSEKSETISKYVGVSYITKGKKWVASILINKKGYTVGLFSSEIEAHLAYKEALSNWENFGQYPTYKRKIKTSPYKGVSTSGKFFLTGITINKQYYFLGQYLDENEAKNAYEKALFDYKNSGKLPKYVNKKQASAFRGVTYHKVNKRWIAAVKGCYLGSFSTEIEAAEKIKDYLGLDDYYKYEYKSGIK
jgi:hypothetical protein